MLTLLVVLVAADLLVSVVDLFVDLKSARPVRRRDAVRQAADHGVAYAEQVARMRKMTGLEKFQSAVVVARDELASLKVKATDAEIGRAIEIAISATKR